MLLRHLIVLILDARSKSPSAGLKLTHAFTNTFQLRDLDRKHRKTSFLCFNYVRIHAVRQWMSCDPLRATDHHDQLGWHAAKHNPSLRFQTYNTQQVNAKRTFHSFLLDEPLATRSNGGARRDRTDDLMLAKHALSQLSYGPILASNVTTATNAYTVTSTSQSPKANNKWWAWEDLNFRPHAYQARALTN